MVKSLRLGGFSLLCPKYKLEACPLKPYESLFGQYGAQKPETIFAHFYPPRRVAGPPDFDEPFKEIARVSLDGYDSWTFQQPKFRTRHAYSGVPKLKNYLNYTFVRLLTLETEAPGEYFQLSANQKWICFNTGLQNAFGADLYATFQRYEPKPGCVIPPGARSDWVYKNCQTPNDRQYRAMFGVHLPKLAWYSKDSRDYVFDTSYHLDNEAFDHLFERAKERAGLPAASPDEAVRNYLRGAIDNLVPKIARNYKLAIPVYFVDEKRMQLLLPFFSLQPNEVSCFLVERDDANEVYRIKTIFDLDQAYFSARLITRPDKDWLNP
jgi:hypothetical protein